MKLFIPLFSILLLAPALRAEPPLAITPDLVDRLLAEAQAANPALQAASAQTDAASASVDSVRVWDDPVASIGYLYFTPRGFDAAQNGDITYGLQERLPLFNRPRLARQAAEAGAVKEELNLGFQTEQTRRDLTTALIELALADEEVELARQDLGWLDATREAVDHDYRVGKASQVEWLKIQTERATAADSLLTLSLEQEHGATELNRLLNRDLHAPWPAMALPELPVPVSYSDRLVDAALAAEPKLKVMRQETAEAEAAAAITRSQRQPDISVGLQAVHYSGDAGLREAMATVSFSLPWLNARRYGQDLRRDLARVRASEFEATDYELSVREDLHHMTIDLDAARRQVLLYRDNLIPLADQTLASARAAWTGNLGSFQDVLDARRMLVADRLMLARALADAGKIEAELCFRTGVRGPGALCKLADAPSHPAEDLAAK